MKQKLATTTSIIFITLNLLTSFTASENILFYFGVSTYSHRIAAWPFVTNLASRGHNVTFVTVYPPRPEHVHPNVTEFFPTNNNNNENGAIISEFTNILQLRLDGGRLGSLQVANALPDVGYDVCANFLSSPDTTNWIQNSSFDLIIIDALFNECGFGLGYKFNAKIILFGTSSVFSWWHDAFGFPIESNYISDMLVGFSQPMDIWERAFSTIFPSIQYYVKYWLYYPKMDGLLRDKLGEPAMPSIMELERDRTSLILLSSHFSEEFARSLPPLIVPVGGIHLDYDESTSSKKVKSIPKEIKKWIDESGPNGFIYVSFGSAVMISEAPEELQNIFFTAFNNTKIRFLWKWETQRPTNMPSNVLTAKWMPQNAILGHPNIKAFITHAGLMGLSEAITNGVPVLMFPIFAEQDYNAYRYEAEGRGLRLEISTLNVDKLQSVLVEVITNPAYKETMMRTMKLYKDRPMSPLQTAIWWTEYVLRHDNLTSLKPLAMHQTWAQRRLLDVWALIFGILILVSGVGFYIIKYLLCLIQRLRRNMFYEVHVQEKQDKLKDS